MQVNRENFVERMKRRANNINKSMRSETEDIFNSTRYERRSGRFQHSIKNDTFSTPENNNSILNNKISSAPNFRDRTLPSQAVLVDNSTRPKRLININNINNNNNSNIKSNYDQENVLDASVSALNDSSTLMKEMHDLSAEIAQLNFNPKVFELVQDKQVKSKKQAQKVSGPNRERNDANYFCNNNQSIKDVFRYSSKKENENRNKSCSPLTVRGNVQELAVQDDTDKNANQSCNLESFIGDDNDFRNVTFCIHEKTSSVSCYSISSSTDNDSRDSGVSEVKEQNVKVVLHSNTFESSTRPSILKMDKSRVSQMNRTSGTKEELSSKTFKSGGNVYPDLTLFNLDEINETSAPDKNISSTPLKSTFGMKLRRLFHSPDDSTKPKNSMISKKRPNNRFKNFTDKLKNKFARHPKHTICLPDLNFPVNPITYKMNGHEIQELLQELKIQQTLIHQAGKALMLCQSMKEFNASEEQIESERSILLGKVRTKAILDEIDMLVKEDLDGTEDSIENDAVGEIRLNSIELLLKREAVDELSRKNQTEYFVVVIVHRLFVWASKVLCNLFDNLNIVLPDVVTIASVQHDFKVKVQVYGMKLENSVKLSHETKYRISRNDKVKKSPNKFIQRQKSSGKMKTLDEIPSDTQFELVGQLELEVEDLYLKSPWLLNNVPKTTTLQHFINFNFTCKVDLPVSHSGFVNHGYMSEGYAAWNRRWCVLNEHVLKLWNYPQQEDEQPLLVIDLLSCISPIIEVADRVVCAKPRTIIIDTVSRKANLDKLTLDIRSPRKVKRNLFSFDTNEDLNEWLSRINQVLSSLHKWNKFLYEESLTDKSFD